MALTDDQKRFLEAYAQCGNVSAAARKAGTVREYHYRKWLADEEYAQAFADAKPIAAAVLEDAAWDRAVNGWEDPVYQGGQEVGKIWRYDSGLLKFLLRGNMPDKYGDKVTQQHEGGVEVVVTYERAPTNRD